MEETKKSVSVRHISFTPEEDQVVQDRAQQAGMSVCGYIRQQAVQGTVKSIDWKRLEKHTEAINYIAEQIRMYTSDKRPNPWLFEADLELIDHQLGELLDMELRLVAEICKDAS